ncbi:MAG: hypothetical protein IPM48_00195 [Saprospiraceae bacterium]|nr:hypothetical protein [Saprospiraceae bacterium]
MMNEILQLIHQPEKLENLYRTQKPAFTKSFLQLFPSIKDEPAAQFWYARLNQNSPASQFTSPNEIMIILLAIFVAGCIAKIPDLAGLEQEHFYSRNISFVIFPILTAFFAWKQKLSRNKLALLSGIYLVSIFYINYLPENQNSDTLILACIHLPLFLWAVMGFAFVGDHTHSYLRRLDFLRFNGDLLVLSAILMIACGLLAAMSFGMFELIGLDIEPFFEQYLLIWGLPAVPITASFLVRSNPQLVNKISPIVARLFTPLVLLMLVIYLIAVFATGKDPYNDREFLILFNALLIGVMAIVFFSAAEILKNKDRKIETYLLFALAITTIVVNVIALSAIIFRVSEWGFTPNRTAVLGSNLLILSNLLLITHKLFLYLKTSGKKDFLEKSFAGFLPIYIIWSVLVCFLFPLLFGFK